MTDTGICCPEDGAGSRWKGAGKLESSRFTNDAAVQRKPAIWDVLPMKVLNDVTAGPEELHTMTRGEKHQMINDPITGATTH